MRIVLVAFEDYSRQQDNRLPLFLIDDAKALGGNTLGELAQLEVFRQAYLWVKNYRCVHNKEIFFVCYR